MKTLNVSSSLQLHSGSKDNYAEYVKAGLEFHKKMGFDAANLDLIHPIFDTDGWQAAIEDIRDASDKSGMAIKITHLPFAGGSVQKNEEFLAKLKEKICRCADAAVILGADYAVMHPVVPTLSMKSFNRAEQYDLVMKNLAPIVEYTNKIGLNVVIENMRITPHFVASHRYCQDPEDLCKVADALGIGVCWDFGHANISGVKQSEGLAYVGKRLKVIHVNDNGSFEDDHLLPFMGNIDWKDAMHGLALAEFEGLFNYEIATAKWPASVRELTAKYMLEVADVLQSYIQ